MPRADLPFWLSTVLCAVVGEAMSDGAEGRSGQGAVVVMGGVAVGLVGMLGLQFRLRRHVPAVYWAVVVLTAIVAGQASDALTDRYGVLPVAAGCATCLGLGAGLWSMSDQRRAPVPVSGRGRERLYWLGLLITFALGTSVGDVVADGSLVGYWPAVAFFAALIVLVVVMRFALGMGSVAAFWSAYVLVQPFGASLARELVQSDADGGVGLGAARTSVVGLGLMVVAVAFSTGVRRMPPRRGDAEPQRRSRAADAGVRSADRTAAC